MKRTSLICNGSRLPSLNTGWTAACSGRGHQPDEEVAADFSAIDVLVMPYEDGMSMRRSTLTAALANGCAIVTTHPEAPTPELNPDSDLMLVPPRDPAATAEAVAADCCGPAPGAKFARQCTQSGPPVQLGCDRRTASGGVQRIGTLPPDHHFMFVDPTKVALYTV